MADNENISDGLGGTVTVSMDEAASGQVQRVKLTYSADGSDTHVDADSSGLRVNLGANNDVTLTSGTLTALQGTSTVSVSGTASVSAAVSSIAAGTNRIGYTGISADGTAVADILSLTNGTAVAVGLYDTDGDQLTFAAPLVLSASVTNGTATYASGDQMGAELTFSSATTGSGKTGHIIGARAFVADDVSEDLRLWLLDSSATLASDNAAFNLSTTDIVRVQGVISFEDWYDGGTAHVSVGRLTPMGHPIAYTTSGSGSLYGAMESRGTGTYGTATVSVELIALKD